MLRNPRKTKPVLVRVSIGSCNNGKDQCSTMVTAAVAEGDDEGYGWSQERYCEICKHAFNPEQVSRWSDKKVNLVKTFCIVFGVQFDPSCTSRIIDDQFPCCSTCLEELELLDRYYKKLELVSNQLDLVRDHLIKLMATGYVTKKVPIEIESQTKWKSCQKYVLDKLMPAWKLDMEFNTLKEKMTKNATFIQDLIPQELAVDEEMVQDNFDQFDDTDQALGQDIEASEIVSNLIGVQDQEVKSEYDDDDGGKNSYYYVIEGDVGGEFLEEDIESYAPTADDMAFSQAQTSQNEDVGIGNLEPTAKRTMRCNPSKPKKEGRTFRSKMKSLLKVKPKLNPHNTGKGRLDCHFCKRKFSSSLARSSHEKNHRLSTSDKKVYCCHFCSRDVNFRGSFIKHLEITHMETCQVKYGDEFYFYSCDSIDCNKCFNTPQLLEEHIQLAHSTSDKPLPIKCVKCEKIFAEEGHYKTHIQNTHCIQPPAWACEYCHLDFEKEKRLQLHKSIHLVKVTRADMPCPVCGKQFRDSVALGLHKFKNHGPQRSELKERTHQKPFKCDGCGRRFFTSRGLLRHSKKHTSGNLAYKHFPCSFCSLICRSQRALERHESGHKREKQRCRFCSRLLNQNGNIKRHEYNCNKEKFLESTPFFCELCYEAFAREDELKSHQANCANKNCKFCRTLFSDLPHLKLHLQARHPSISYKEYLSAGIEWDRRRTVRDRDKSGFCEICGKLVRSFKQHKHSDILESSRNCIYGCTDSFYTFSQVRQHYIAKHREEYAPKGSVYCVKCYRVFNNVTDLKKHEEAHVGRYKCEVCGKTYTDSTNLRNHRYEHVTNAEVFCCNVCGKIFKNPVAYKKHLNIHAEHRTYYQRAKCTHCGKNMGAGRSYRLHLYNEHREHFLTDNTAFYCSLCYQTFGSQHNLDTHLTRHPKCQYCDRRFENKFKLSEHEFTHTGAKPYQCSICGKRFAAEANHRIHLKLHSGERPLHCQICPDKVGFFRRRNLEQHMQKYHTS